MLFELKERGSYRAKTKYLLLSGTLLDTCMHYFIKPFDKGFAINPITSLWAKETQKPGK